MALENWQALKVLLIQSSTGSEYAVYPLGLSSIAACMRGHVVKLFDLNTAGDPAKELVRFILQFKPDLIGISLRNIDNQDRMHFQNYYRKYFQTEIRLIKETAPDVPLVTGGSGFSLFPGEIMLENPEIDYGVVLEAEESFPELLQNLHAPWSVKGVLYRDGGTVKHTGYRALPEFSALPTPRRDVIDFRHYRHPDSIGVQSKRGCSQKCSYCTYPFLGGSRIRSREPKKVVDEIEELSLRYGISSFFFADTVFNIPIQQATEICKEILRRRLRVKWGAYMDLKYADQAFLLLAHQAGCFRFMFSPDGYSNGALRGLNKPLTQAEIDAHIHMLFQQKQLKGTNAVYHFLINSPGETLGGFLQTLGKCLWLKYILKKSKRGDVCIGWIRIEPATEVFNLAIKQGSLRPDKSLLPKFDEPVDFLFYRHPKLNIFDSMLIGARKIASKMLTATGISR